MIVLDGTRGEGGGSMLRYALALSTLTKKPFRMENVRKGRDKPGLKAQHLFCIRGLEDLCGAKSEGAILGSENVVFYPGAIVKDSLNIDIGTAGSITLLLQSFLLPLLFHEKKVYLKITGGTDVPFSQPLDYFRNVFLPALSPYAKFEVECERRGFYPKGGGKVKLTVEGKYRCDSGSSNIPLISLNEHEKLVHIHGNSFAAKELEKNEVANRMKRSCRKELTFYCPIKIDEEYIETHSAGAGIVVWAVYEHGVLGGSFLGERNIRAEDVGRNAALDLKKEMDSNACVDRHLADQLVPYMGAITAVTGKECVIRTSEITNHLRSNVYVTEMFLDVHFTIEGEGIRCHR